MNARHTIGALVILAVLGGLLYFVYQQPVPVDPRAIPREPLFSFDPEDIVEFRLEMAAERPASFRRIEEPPAEAEGAEAEAAEAEPAAASFDEPESQWEVLEPSGIDADSYLVEGFLAEFYKFQAVPLTGEVEPEWEAYGLEEPQRKLEFKLKDGNTVLLEVGEENPSGYARYGRRNGEGPLLLLDTEDNKALLEKTLFDLRDKRILPMEMNAANRITLHYQFGDQAAAADEMQRARQLGLSTRPARMGFERGEDGNWRLREPRLRTDTGGATYLATILAGALMKKVVQEQAEEQAGALAPYGLNRPRIRVEVSGPEGEATLLIGEETSEETLDATTGDATSDGSNKFYFAKNSLRPHVFTILKNVYDQLNRDLEYYRNRYLFDFETSSATRVEINGPTGELLFERRGADWYRAGIQETQMAELKVDNFLNSIHSLRIQSYVNDALNQFATYGLNDPWVRVRVTFGEQGRQETILFSRQGEKFYGAREGEPSVYEMAPREPEIMEGNLEDLIS